MGSEMCIRDRCPHCTKSFLLSQILDQAVPELELIEDQHDGSDYEVDTGTTKDENGRFVVPKQLRRRSKRSRSGRKKTDNRSRHRETGVAVGNDTINTPDVTVNESIELNGSNLAANHEAPSVTNGANGVDLAIDSESSAKSERPRPSSRRRSRRPRRESDSKPRRSKKPNPYKSANSPAGEILKVAIGGLLAIPIAYLLVLWVFKQDPLKVAPTIVDKAPFLVPSHFHPIEIEAEEPSATDPEPAKPEDNIIPDVSGGGLAKPKLDPDSFNLK